MRGGMHRNQTTLGQGDVSVNYAPTDFSSGAKLLSMYFRGNFLYGRGEAISSLGYDFLTRAPNLKPKLWGTNS